MTRTWVEQTADRLLLVASADREHGGPLTIEDLTRAAATSALPLEQLVARAREKGYLT